MRHSSLSLVALVSCLVLSVGACKKIEEPQKAPVPQQQPAEPAATQPVEPPPEPVQQEVAGQRPALPPLFKDIEKRTFQFFWDTTNEVNGMTPDRSEEHTSELQSLMRISYAVFCLKKKNTTYINNCNKYESQN